MILLPAKAEWADVPKLTRTGKPLHIPKVRAFRAEYAGSAEHRPASLIVFARCSASAQSAAYRFMRKQHGHVPFMKLRVRRAPGCDGEDRPEGFVREEVAR